MKTSCEKCKWWHRLSSSSDAWKNTDIRRGECHGAPPTARMEIGRLNPGDRGPQDTGSWTIHYHEGVFPTTCADEFCAMFVKR